MTSPRLKKVILWIYALGATVLALSFSWPAFSAPTGDVVIVEGNCPDGQHADIGGSCTCTDSREILFNGECALDPNRLFGDIGGIFVDFCDFLGACDGGGGGGGTPPEPEPEDEEEEAEGEDECNDDDEQCNADHAQCAATAFETSEACGIGAALNRCSGNSSGMVFPGGAKPTCRIISKTGRIFCTFPDSLQNPPFVGEPGGLFGRCLTDWQESGELAGEISQCQTEALTEMEECQDKVLDDCECFVPTSAAIVPASLPSSGGSLDQEPEHGVFLRAKVRTKGETAIDAEAFVRNATKSTCYWHLTEGLDAPEGTLYCEAGGEWDDVGASRFLMADGNQYLADGACGVATQDGVASGSATFLWKVERDADGLLVGARMKSVAGHIVGSLDGAHPYYGDCKVTGKAIEERQVPSSLLELVRER